MKLTDRTPTQYLFVACTVSAAAFGTSDARADAACTVDGDAVMSASAKLYLEAAGGSPHARFTGGQVTLTATDFPKARGGRAKVKLGGFGLEGYVKADDLPLYTTRRVPVYQGHLWIGKQRDVTAIGAAPGKIHIEKQVHFPMNQTFKAWADCSALTFTQQPAPGWSPPGSARGYVGKDSVELFTGVDGGSVTTLFPSGAANGILLWSTHSERGWVNVEFHGDVVINAWAKPRSLRPLPRGETMDQLYPPTIRKGRPVLKLATEPRIVKKDTELPIRARAGETAPIIGKVAPGTELYLIDVVAGWASVMPKSLGIAPHGDSHFWVSADALGL